jgi:hypothetical protein
MAKRRGTVNIGNTDANADWIKTPENRETERLIHDDLEKRHAGSQEEIV